MSKLKIFITFLFLISHFPSLAYSNIYDRAFIINLAKEFVESNTPVPIRGKRVIEPASIDSRITLKPCAIPLTANIPDNYSSRNVNVKISCESSTPWHLFLLVRVTVTVPVLATKYKINKGTILDKSNIMVEWRELNSIRSEILDDIDLIIGARSKRTLSQGAIITKRAICVVCKNENVTIIAKSDNFMIKTAGIALKNATFGEQVKVKNTRSGRTINAQVNAINQVVINL
ncbi:flagellar basal body P-ring formation chaperone FlgA [Thalassotalea castellviae]|uniref:Flagella basal body P-ring formation protein FlgA n=1 Tax=Thalassotalea castellviae TaxID=3075612 RepID=A0ABU2ZZB8_9GAMM|nr:flagellar basal body P-ring formation chaperone FlgA [Thalassotalea sp. W431]MDT0602885.1 flagellar basal body P-ring formation chaperone FlgA [Thalassotalea sp. W431]